MKKVILASFVFAILIGTMAFVVVGLGTPAEAAKAPGVDTCTDTDWVCDIYFDGRTECYSVPNNYCHVLN